MADIPRQTKRGRAGPFGALLAAAARDPAAARGLALAYASLDIEARGHIVEAVVADARAEEISASAALASLLAVEEDAGLAHAIARAMEEDGGIGLEVLAGPRALVAGDEEKGGVLLVRPLHGTFVEALALSWDERDSITRSFFEPMIHDGDASHLVARLPEGLRFEEMPMRFVIDRLAPVLWAHRRRHGELPSGIDRFADLFSIAQTVEPA